MKIQHYDYGVVDGVSKVIEALWHKIENGRSSYFHETQGWSPVPEKKWVTIEVEEEGWKRLYDWEHIYAPPHLSLMPSQCARTKWRYPR